MGCVLKALVTVELQLCGDLLFFLGFPDRIQHKIDVLLGAGLVGNNTVGLPLGLIAIPAASFLWLLLYL